MKLLRWVLGRIVLSVNFITSPKAIVREEAEQDKIDALTANMSLYQFSACPFCVKVRRKLKKHALKIELRDAKNNMMFKEELTSQGGKHKVPCLRIENDSEGVKWLYESDDIISFLETKLKLA